MRDLRAHTLESLADLVRSLDGQLKLKQDDWIEACREIDTLKAARDLWKKNYADQAVVLERVIAERDLLLEQAKEGAERLRFYQARGDRYQQALEKITRVNGMMGLGDAIIIAERALSQPPATTAGKVCTISSTVGAKLCDDGRKCICDEVKK